MRLWKNPRHFIRNFCRAERGNVMVTFALAIVPIIGFIGTAVDYSRANSAKAAMQSAVDSVALMLSKDAPTLTSGQLNEKANAIFKALFDHSDVAGVVVTPTFSSPTASDFKLTVAASGEVPTSFSKVFGVDELSLSVKSQVLWGMKKLELTLALDNTGSMAWSGKMDALKSAAKSLLDTLKKAAVNTGDVKVAIVPFNTDVNVGKQNVNANWLGWTEWEEENGDDISSMQCSNSRGRRRRCSTSTTWVPDDHNKWTGCLTDRDQDYDVKDTSPTTTIKATLFPPHQGDPCPVTLRPLTSDWNDLNSTINAMKPDGSTNVTIGLTWAWHALTANAPLTQAAAPAPDLDKVIILLTDGENTENRWTSSTSQIDGRMKKACDNIKAANIKLYTIRVIAGNASLLKSCATKPEMYFDVQQASQLNGVFSAIAQNLANLRIAK